MPATLLGMGVKQSLATLASFLDARYRLLSKFLAQKYQQLKYLKFNWKYYGNFLLTSLRNKITRGRRNDSVTEIPNSQAFSHDVQSNTLSFF